MTVEGVKGGKAAKVDRPVQADVNAMMADMAKFSGDGLRTLRDDAANGLRELANKLVNDVSPALRESATRTLELLSKGLLPPGAPNAPGLEIESGKPAGVESGKAAGKGWRP